MRISKNVLKGIAPENNNIIGKMSMSPVQRRVHKKKKDAYRRSERKRLSKFLDRYD